MCICFICSFEDLYKKLSLWLHEMEERIRTEGLGDRKQHIPEKKNEVQKVEAFLEEVLVERYQVLFINEFLFCGCGDALIATKIQFCLILCILILLISNKSLVLCNITETNNWILFCDLLLSFLDSK